MPVHRLANYSQARIHLGLMLALTFSTGVIDAVGYLGLDKVFTGNMTGNVVILGMALTGAEGLPVAGPAVALVSFMAGAAVGFLLEPQDANNLLLTAGVGFDGVGRAGEPDRAGAGGGGLDVGEPAPVVAPAGPVQQGRP